ncbi:fungal-specific transcription factor domain-containing protein [Exophiala viscosa]|uniref:fungal-specific transcription factor domain-containing protein n=1 Tax=Exophiala viscosa TaxID=2486360 RepID=UPI00219214C5|nr:fungal-specific transcription factor domain-containing protein [Exophiala viscosa]
MDPRQSLSRTTSSGIGTPQAGYNPNSMASGYMPQYQNNTHLPPINYSQLPPANQNYMPQQYRNDLPRYTSAPSTAPIPSPAPDNRYNPQMTQQGSMGGLPPTSMLPSPHQSQQQAPPPQQQQQQPAHQGYQQQQQPARQNYPQPLAPAPPRPNLDSLAPGYPQPDNRQQPWSGAESMPSMATDVGRDPTRTHVVGSQGRRGILPSAPGRPPVMANGVNGSPKSNAVPQKDADGKFPCPNCTKTYLHAKHLKRHMLRHTGDRPYMCVLCNDTFSRSDILKRHFQKCSVRRGNPTGASHLSNPAAHLKKSQQAAAKAAAAANQSPASATTPTSGVMNNPPYTTAAMPSTSAPTTTAPAPGMSYGMQSNGQGDMQRQGQPMQGASGPGGMDPNANNSWSMHNSRNNQMMYHSTSTPPDHFGMQPGGGDDKRNVMPGTHHMGDEWNHMFQPGGNEGYMNPMFGGYDQSQGDVKKEYESHEGGSNGYYIPSTSLGADGTLGPPLWNLHASQQDVFQAKVNALLTFVFPGGIQESLQEQQNNLDVQSCLTVDAIQHFLDLFPNFLGHFPWLHVPTFDFATAYDGLVLVIICSGAVYSDHVSQDQVRLLMQLVRSGIERTSKILKNLELGIPQPHFSPSKIEYEELLALTILQTLLVWHGGPDERALARAESKRVMYLVRQFDMLTLAGSEDPVGYSYLHSLQPGEEADPSRWDWRSWIEQEKRSRLMFMVFLWDAAMCIYFNESPQFSSAEIKLPLPCDDAAWDAPDAESCAQALGLRGPVAQSRINLTGSQRLKQLETHHAMSALHSMSVLMQPRTTNIYSKFILIHALHVEIWQIQRQHSFNNPSTSQTASMYNSINMALDRWKQSWDADLALQYPTDDGTQQTPKRVGFCRDGVHFYWLARAFMQPNRLHDWQLPADSRLQQTLHGLKKAREWSRSDGARRGEDPGSVADIEDQHATATQVLDMRKLFRPLHMISDGFVPTIEHSQPAYH